MGRFLRFYHNQCLIPVTVFLFISRASLCFSENMAQNSSSAHRGFTNNKCERKAYVLSKPTFILINVTATQARKVSCNQSKIRALFLLIAADMSCLGAAEVDKHKRSL